MVLRCHPNPRPLAVLLGRRDHAFVPFPSQVVAIECEHLTERGDKCLTELRIFSKRRDFELAEHRGEDSFAFGGQRKEPLDVLVVLFQAVVIPGANFPQPTSIPVGPLTTKEFHDDAIVFVAEVFISIIHRSTIQYQSSADQDLPRAKADADEGKDESDAAARFASRRPLPLGSDVLAAGCERKDDRKHNEENSDAQRYHLARTVLKTPELVFGSRDEALLPVYHFDRLPTVSGGFHNLLRKAPGRTGTAVLFSGSQPTV